MSKNESERPQPTEEELASFKMHATERLAMQQERAEQMAGNRERVAAREANPQKQAELEAERAKFATTADSIARQARDTIAAIDSDPARVAEQPLHTDYRTEFNPHKAHIIAQVIDPEMTALTAGAKGKKANKLEIDRRMWEAKAKAEYRTNPDVQAEYIRPKKKSWLERIVNRLHE